MAIRVSWRYFINCVVIKCIVSVRQKERLGLLHLFSKWYSLILAIRLVRIGYGVGEAV